MNDTLLDVEIRIGEPELIDREVWSRATTLLRERTCAGVRVAVDWPERVDGETVRLPLRIAADARDAVSIAERFVHDAFLLFNLASPGSFGGTIGIQGAGEFLLDARVFVYARQDTGTVRLEDVVRWYDAAYGGRPARNPAGVSPGGNPVGPGHDAPRDAGGTPAVRNALFHLLHLAGAPEDELLSVVRLADAAKSLGIGGLKVFELLAGELPAGHPLDENDELSLEWIDAADEAASAVVGALQEQVRIRAPQTDL